MSFYDLTVPETACYFDAQGVLHHNSGKDWLSAKANAYVAFLLCNMADPIAYYRDECGLQLARDTKLASLNVYLRSNLSAPLFDRYRPHILTEQVNFYTDEERERAVAQKRPPNPFFQLLSKHSKSSGLDGYNLIFWVMDEADAFYDKSEKSNAEEVHGILRSSCNTRLKIYWTGMVISYPRVKEGFMLRTYERAQLNMNKHGTKAGYYADLAATWDVRPSVSRNDPNMAEDYEHDPDEAAARYECVPMETIDAAARYECVPMETIDAFIEMPEKVDAAVDHDAQPCAIVIVDDYQSTRNNGYEDFYVKARIAGVHSVPGYEYFLGGDAGQKRDAYALSVWHADMQSDGFAWICPRCVGQAPTLLNGARYVKQDKRAREAVKPNEYIICGCCFTTSAEYNGSFSIGSVSVADWYKKTVDDASVITDGQGRAYNVGHVYEDLLVQVKPVWKGHGGNVNRSVYFPAIQSVCRELIEKLPIAVAQFDPYQTAEITMGLRESTGGDIDEISFSGPEQYKRAKLAKTMLYAGLLHFQPSPERDREWKRIRRVNGNKIDHPEGPNESKDLWDAELVAIWLAVNRKVGSVDIMFGADDSGRRPDSV